MRTGQREPRERKTKRAWAAYLEVTGTAEWIERKLSTPLGVFGISREEFRLMVTLYRDGPMTVSEAMERLGRIRQAVFVTVQRMEDFGWVRRAHSRLPPRELDENRLPRAKRGKPRAGLRVVVISLTPQGERLIGNVLPKQEQIVKVLMHALESRELDSLMRICGKLRKEDNFTKIRFASALIRAGEGAEREDRGEE